MSRKLLVSLVLLCCVSVGWALGCEEVPPGAEGEVLAHGVVNGTPTKYATWQGAVGVRVGDRICTGTLIHPEVVATAGHCVYFLESGVDVRNSPGKVKVVGGANLQKTSSTITYPAVERIVLHEKWGGSIQDATAVDLALLRLAAPVTGVETYGLRAAPEPVMGEAGILVGYGLTDETATSSWGVHRMGNAEVYNTSPEVFEVGGGAGTCSGDSGGPFFTQQNGAWVLTGVTSFGLSNECTVNGGSWLVNVVNYRGWYDKQLRALVGEGLPGMGDSDTGTGPAASGDSGGADTSVVDTGAATDGDTSATSSERPGNSSCAFAAAPRGLAASMLAWFVLLV